VTIAPSTRLGAILTVLATFLVVVASAPAAHRPGSAHRSDRRSEKFAAIGAGHKARRANVCASISAARRGGRLRPRRRQRLARIARSCQRRLATQSSAPPAPLYWGAWIGNQLTGEAPPWDMSAVSKFEEMTGKPMSLIHFAAPFANCSSSPCSFYGFPKGPMESIREHGSIPFFSWSSQSIPSSLNEPNFQLSDVINGAYDSYIRSFAEAAREWGHPFFLRFDWEMNGNWFPWSEGVNGNQAGEYVAAWRHVHDIFAEAGATNATWVWCPNVDPGNRLQNVASLYPGDGYVDWTGLDGYNWGTNPASPKGWMSFNQLYRPTYRQIVETIAPSKPMVVSEVGSSEYGGSKADWIREMLGSVPTEYPKIRGLLWFEKYDDGMDWPIETSGSATSAFAEGIQSPAYVGSQYGSLGGGPVQPPS
jgi:Glycosyl hydrolase family 26